MKSTAKILVIIVTWNKKQYVIDLLNSLSAISFPRSQLDILVVDNASNDGTVAALESQFTDIQIIRNKENIGGTGGFNTGLAWAFDQPDGKYDYIWLLDNDVVVHQEALSELASILDNNSDIAVAGSTMMQLDYPWRINEMGSYVDLDAGTLLFHRHFEEIQNWRNKPIAELLTTDNDLSQLLMHCQDKMDVDYVAAASLLIRAPVAKEAGLWMDFFIHFDDVEWCLRINQAGHRVVVSARSLIWHLSAMAKIPSWILYYDNRNILYLLDKYSDTPAIKNSISWTLKKALYYKLSGKGDLANLHTQAIDDFKSGIKGKKAINLPYKFEKIAQITQILHDPKITKILVPSTINMQASKLQDIIVTAMHERPELEITYMVTPHNPQRQLPNAKILRIPLKFIPRYLIYYRIRKQFDLTLQSDYQVIIPLSWIAKKVLFINDETFCLRPPVQTSDMARFLLEWAKKWLHTKLQRTF